MPTRKTVNPQTDKAVFRNVWKLADPQVERDAVAAWEAAGVVTKPEDVAVRLKQLCIAGYEESELVTLSTIIVRYSHVVRENMAFLRVFVAKGHREKGLVIPLTYATHEAMSAYALANPQMKIGGTMGVVAAHGTMDRPVLGAQMMLAGYSKDNDPLVLRWFDHYKLDEEAARARTRVPRTGPAR